MIVNGWVDWAVRVNGIPDKVYSQPNSGEWITCHSVVGREDEFQDGIPNRFLDTSKDANGRYTANAAASCMFILRENGTLIQMYPITASTWTSGGFEANTRSWAIEAEGGLFPNYSEPLTEFATQTFIRLVGEWEAFTGRKAIPGLTLRQHKDVAAQFGYAPTACASDRYAQAWTRVALGERYDDMDEAKVEEIARRVFGEVIAPYYRALTRQYWDANAPGAYSDPPEEEVIDAIRKLVCGPHTHGEARYEDS